ncbi:hypothetical protein B0H13DRAFT_1895357 [Mycena leptocephala]|nr:hypothetical protein B0H13DRAFT_1895357 [Mycena leptocephala]
MVKETYNSDRSLPSAISTLRHVMKRMSMTESPHVMEAFVLAVRSFTEKEYAAQGDSTRSVNYLTYNVLLGIYVLQLSALISRVHRIPPRLASTAIPNEAARTSYLIALDKAVQEYASSRTEGMDEAFSQEVLTEFKEIEDGTQCMCEFTPHTMTEARHGSGSISMGHGLNVFRPVQLGSWRFAVGYPAAHRLNTKSEITTLKRAVRPRTGADLLVIWEQLQVIIPRYKLWQDGYISWGRQAG